MVHIDAKPSNSLKHKSKRGKNGSSESYRGEEEAVIHFQVQSVERLQETHRNMQPCWRQMDGKKVSWRIAVKMGKYNNSVGVAVAKTGQKWLGEKRGLPKWPYVIMCIQSLTGDNHLPGNWEGQNDFLRSCGFSLSSTPCFYIPKAWRLFQWLWICVWSQNASSNVQNWKLWCDSASQSQADKA